MIRSDQTADLGVVSREVGDAGGWWFAAECGVGSVMIVDV